jgi:hypothetical protein
VFMTNGSFHRADGSDSAVLPCNHRPADVSTRRRAVRSSNKHLWLAKRTHLLVVTVYHHAFFPRLVSVDSAEAHWSVNKLHSAAVNPVVFYRINVINEWTADRVTAANCRRSRDECDAVQALVGAGAQMSWISGVVNIR